MSSCHYCFDIVSKLNEEYDILYKQLEFADNIIKKYNYKYCLSLIPKLRNHMKEMYDDETLFDSPEDRKDYEFNSKNFLRQIQDFSLDDEWCCDLYHFGNDD